MQPGTEAGEGEGGTARYQNRFVFEAQFDAGREVCTSVRSACLSGGAAEDHFAIRPPINKREMMRYATAAAAASTGIGSASGQSEQIRGVEHSTRQKGRNNEKNKEGA